VEVVAPPDVDTPTPTPTPTATQAATLPTKTPMLLTGTPLPPTLTPVPPPPTETLIAVTVTATLTPTVTLTVEPTATDMPADTPTVPLAPPLSIAFFSDRDSPGYSEIYLMNPDGSGQTQLTSNLQVPEIQPGSGSSVISFGWSPASKRFLYNVGGGAELYSVSADGSQKTQLADRVGYFAISPDGRRIALETLAASPPQLATMNVDGTAFAQVTNEDQRLSHPTWSSDGGWIGHSRRDAYWIVDAKGGQAQLLVPPELVPGLYECVWSPQGPVLVCNTLTQPPALHLVDLVSGTTSKLIDAGGWTPAWSPDGNQIAFQRDQQVWVVHADGSGLRQLTSQGLNGYPIWVAGR
jgi:Tol biopolymer transport system component